MNANIEPNTELDFDAWLTTGNRTTHNVNLFARMDLIAEIETLEAQRIETPKTPEADMPMGGEDNPNTELDAQIEELEARIYASKRVFRVTALTEQEISDIRTELRTSNADKLDELAAKGRAEALLTTKRMDMKVPSEINTTVRAGAKAYTDEFLNRETGLAMAAKATTTQNSRGEWVGLTVDQMRSLNDMLGDKQMELIVRACSDANNILPEVTPGK